MLNEIALELTSCANKLQAHYSHYQNNLNALRRQVVEPILTVLGWDLDNPSDVQIDDILNGAKIEYLKYGDILDKETVFVRKGIQAIVRVILPNTNVSDAQLIAQTQALLVDKQIPACIITNGKDWHFIAMTKEKKRLNQISGVEDATDWLIYFARPNITYVRIFLTLHMKASAFNIANVILKEFLEDKRYGMDDTNFWSIVKRIQHDFVNLIQNHFPYFSELIDINLFFEKHLAKWIDKGTDASALRVVFTEGANKGKVLYSELAKWVLVETVKAVGLEKVLKLEINANCGEAKVGDEKRQIRLVEAIGIPKIPQEEIEENGKTYFIAHSINNEQKVQILKQLSERVEMDYFTVELAYL